MKGFTLLLNSVDPEKFTRSRTFRRCSDGVKTPFVVGFMTVSWSLCEAGDEQTPQAGLAWRSRARFAKSIRFASALKCDEVIR